MAIQWSDQKVLPFSTVIPVWRDKTSYSSSRNSIGNTRKAAFENYCKTLSAIQRSDQKLWPYSTVIPVWSDKTSYSSSRNSIGNTRKTASETTVKLSWRSNGRIKSYGPIQLLFRSGATRPPLHRAGIPSVIHGKRLRKLV